MRALSEDAQLARGGGTSCARWGGKAGHLALGIGKAAGATLTLIAEEFTAPVVPFGAICDIVEGSIIKRRAAGRHFTAWRCWPKARSASSDPAEVAELEDIERDDHGDIRMAGVDLARKVKVELQGRLLRRGIKVTITNKDIGYELRCADPIAFDAAYCRDLGHGAVRFLAGGGGGAMVTSDGRLVRMPFEGLVSRGAPYEGPSAASPRASGSPRAYVIRRRSGGLRGRRVGRSVVRGRESRSRRTFADRFGHLAADDKADHYRFDDL